ncbi:hypothetical protein DM872_18930 [Pseudomonas taiwanensis]|uniref:hypothetical protein n=1 Tax=Pseudomonas taiwanensis TaxID=470150 RepID=UPI0015BC3CEE|nr:hypothetical protein [Pseudomonas taiwanensis]NWL78925.1 hypothetical protein [Pseudomonas taiwanensis]
MNIEITPVTPSKVTVNGQPLAREYVEGILLPLLVAAQGGNHAGVFKVAKAFALAGLSLDASPVASRVYREHLAEQAQLEARQRAESRVHAERCQVPTPQEIAEKKAKRIAEAARIRDIGAAMRAQLGR